MPVGPVVRDEESAEFFDGTARSVFLLRYCRNKHASTPHAIQCSTCGDPNLTWRPASGHATVVSWSVVPGRPGKNDPGTPTTLVVAELAEGPWWWSQIVDADPNTVEAGAPLRVAFRRASAEHENVPVFETVGSH
ncbi:MAG: OB-fold domain-containing protein [Aeromicrobium sp.]